jgi:hypothetical protein
MKPIRIALLLMFVNCGLIAQVPLNWTRDEINPGEDFTLTADESVFTEGSRSCHLQLNSGSVPYLKSDVFYITPGAEYEFSFDVLDNDTAGQVKIYADFYDVYGFDVFGEAPVFSKDSAEWQTIGWTGIVPAQAAVGYVLIKFYNQPNLYTFTKKADIWLDNFQFRESGGFNIIANGGFEEWQVGMDEAGQDEALISVYPNPAKNFVNIRIPEETDFITINDLAGRELVKITASGNEVVQADVSHLQKGLYVVRANVRNRSSIAQKLLID